MVSLVLQAPDSSGAARARELPNISCPGITQYENEIRVPHVFSKPAKFRMPRRTPTLEKLGYPNQRLNKKDS